MKPLLRTLTLAAAAVLLWMIVSASFWPGGQVYPYLPYWRLRIDDGLGHLLAYAGLTAAGLAWLRLRGARSSVRSRAPWTVIGGAMLMSSAIEIAQPHFGRHSDIADWICNFAGIALAAAGWLALSAFAAARSVPGRRKRMNAAQEK
ncbi:MAG: hypothetical protein BWZ10_02443 [candidate division BRC1 bacterium ADurb.BinA364]|nr:MAG: hypothetical protein BWZ10_02443 [candidate division BRC1 bacterium ADurb.BinA364]